MILLEEGRELYNSGKYEEAIKCFDKAKDVDICEILEEKCISLNYIGKYKEALKFADEAIEKCNGYENALALAIKAEALGYIGNYLDAIANADKAIRLSEKNKYEDLVCYAKFVKGYALDYHGKHDEAKERFNEVIQNKECHDEHVEALIGKG